MSKSSPEPERPHIPLPKQTLEDTALLVTHELNKKGWVDEAYEEFVNNGGMDLPGLGKPLIVPTDDILTTILKNAKVSPPWIMLRKEIGENMSKLLELCDKSPSDPEIEALLADTNQQIAELNHQAPSLTLHRLKLTRSNLREQYARWYR
ncbi:DUF1992 domain-containing protein [Paenibacillus cremeus]|uniref:DUF1992 domain-containing protein n=1 Tax=Paenibacillus cremeus TaxID=2163881 RepID=A0A559KDP1_9BACL|nr:DUF1992 domain-containing protein [Paenibacillus cremeus]TVY10252.1 DUF1992 domain-containing protein [Paenibacillus cremeus]